MKTTSIIRRTLDLNETQRAALISVGDGHPAGYVSTFTALRNRGLIEDSAVYVRARYSLTSDGYEIYRALTARRYANE